MSDVGEQLAIRWAGRSWRVYEVLESESFGMYGKVLRDDRGRIRNFDDEDQARAFIESMPDATEAEYPS
jgi:hypothetical protein